ncbi:hypothetical protein ACQ4PT_030124 [Festuca glaucescens]
MTGGGNEYVKIYYPSDNMVQDDAELQAWWKEVREVGHGDIKDQPWWPKMTTVQELVRSCATIIWIASALHAAVNFGQYSYAGYLPNRPTVRAGGQCRSREPRSTRRWRLIQIWPSSTPSRASFRASLECL